MDIERGYFTCGSPELGSVCIKILPRGTSLMTFRNDCSIVTPDRTIETPHILASIRSPSKVEFVGVITVSGENGNNASALQKSKLE